MEIKLPNGEVLTIDKTIDTRVPYIQEDGTFTIFSASKKLTPQEVEWHNKVFGFKEGDKDD